MATAFIPLETVETAARRVACDGDGVLGHPRIFLTLEDGEIECPYCGRRFVYVPAPDSSADS